MNLVTGAEAVRTINSMAKFMEKVVNSPESIVWREEHQVKKENAEIFLKELFELEIVGEDIHLMQTQDDFNKAIEESFYGSIDLDGRFCKFGYIATEDHKEMWIGYISPSSAI